MNALIGTLRAIVGSRHVLTGAQATARYRHGYRTGSGEALAVVRPGSLIEQWRVVQACVAADVSIIMQASNTGLTGGSTPDGDDYPGGCVIISTTRIDWLHLVRNGAQVICLPGTTLYALEKALAPLGREPHSVIGSSCFGASVVGGVCNNSGGSLVQRGPAYTQLSLYAVVDADGGLRLVNHLGVALGNDPEEMLRRLDSGDFTESDVDVATDRWAHDHAYADHVRDIDSSTPARFNADSRCLFEAAGSAGKLIVFAVRLDSFAKEEGAATFYIGTNDPAQLTAIRRALLGDFASLPIAGEYMHRDAFDIADRYGKDMFVAIERLGTDRLPSLFALKSRMDALPFVGDGFSDRMMQRIGRLLPDHLPPQMRDYRDRFEHHLLLKMPHASLVETRALLASLFDTGEGAYFECTPELAAKAFLHRFVAAGAAVRYRAVHREEVEDIVPLDVALPRNILDWQEILPPDLAEQSIHSLYYGHFLCHVFHQDYIVRKGVDPLAFEHRIWALLDERGAEYPAEHNVGHLYKAKPALEGFYRQIDPRNQCNPGIGQTARARYWGDEQKETARS
ncbi:D-lactate dehydrogenase [Sphingobium sp.]|uniref:D-lactate dehydrogenase n=1 Tax=Sphingobium sp. TaxID=1912891 RepID=UPI002CE858EF|nr:D-lactate dehydrogenase [Sphingobium sp.]HUD95879.1 D-lactate dehydrogenase [Sphingobium sp.]